MPRTTSVNLRRALFAQQTGEVLLWLLTLDHPDFAAPIRVCNDARDVESRGEVYHRFPFEISIEGDGGGKSRPRAVLRICNVDRQIVEAVRSVQTAISVTVELARESEPDVIEAGPMEFALREVAYDAVVVEGELRYEEVLSEPFPAATFSPSRFPALF